MPVENRTSELDEWVTLGSTFCNAKNGNIIKFGGWIEIEVPYGGKVIKLWASITKCKTGNFKLDLGLPATKALDQNLINEQNLKRLYETNRK